MECIFYKSPSALRWIQQAKPGGTIRLFFYSNKQSPFTVIKINRRKCAANIHQIPSNTDVTCSQANPRTHTAEIKTKGTTCKITKFEGKYQDVKYKYSKLKLQGKPPINFASVETTQIDGDDKVSVKKKLRLGNKNVFLSLSGNSETNHPLLSCSSHAGINHTVTTSTRSSPLLSMTPSEIIRKKRMGHELTQEEISFFIKQYHEGKEVTDYQMSALMMAMCVRNTSNSEARNICHAMVETGGLNQVNLSHLQTDKPKVDKHSTGGVGDKCSLVLAPLAACLGLVVPMVSSGGLGHTGGTIDKISSIPGLSTNLTSDQYIKQLKEVGCAIVKNNKNFAPVEERMFSLRDVTGSGDNVGLCASSIMAKKISESPDALVLDVKTGSGAFFPRWVDAVSLAQTMVTIGEDAGIATRCILSSMDQPVGSAVGNWLEVRESIQILSAGRIQFDHHPEETIRDDIMEDVRELTITQAAIMLQLAKKVSTFSEGWNQASDMLDSGDCIDMFAQMVQAQGGDPSIVYNPNLLPLSPLRYTYTAPRDCIIESIDTYEIGMASIWAGAGKLHIGDQIDIHAGFLFHNKVGDVLKCGDPIFTAFVGPQSLPSLADPVERLDKGFQRAVKAVHLIDDEPSIVLPKKPLIGYVVDKHNTVPFFQYCSE